MMHPKTARRVALIDIGNTRMKIGWADLAGASRNDLSLALEHQDANQLVDWFHQQGIRPDMAVGVNVAGGHKARAVESLFLDTFELPIHWLGSQPHAAGVLNRYTDPAQLGVDRWMAMIGLSQHPPDATAPLLLASFGTATTLDTLCPAGMAGHDADRPGTLPVPAGNSDVTAHNAIHWVYEGGLIFPGPGLMRSSLANNTAQLPEANGTTTAFPTDTHRAIISGIAAAQAGAVMRQWLAGFGRYGVAPRVYGTGGGWPAVQDEVQSLLATMHQQHGLPQQPAQYLPSPILDGLTRMAADL